ncbi:cbb3-type cytochrome oxidase assembly protein CcoS [Halovulum marinum]|nr:cbb3-type cytochrome oxidase assembly protein CcoS [Halovulum marinum]
MGLIGLGAFIWAMRHQQFDDLEGNAWRVIGATEPADTPGAGPVPRRRLRPRSSAMEVRVSW